MNKKIPLYILIFFSLVSLPLTLFAIEIRIQLIAPKPMLSNVRAIGFSVANVSQGSLGYATTKTGPAGKYSFGIREKGGKSISCGKAKLTKNSFVQLKYDGRVCHINRISSYKRS